MKFSKHFANVTKFANFAKFQKIQLDNLVAFENTAKRVFTCKDRRRYSRKRANFCRNLPKFGNYPQVHTSVRKLNLLQAKLRSLDLGANRVAAAGTAALASALPQSAARGLEVGTLSFFFSRAPKAHGQEALVTC